LTDKKRPCFYLVSGYFEDLRMLRLSINMSPKTQETKQKEGVI
jgi:hypothetical protein